MLMRRVRKPRLYAAWRSANAICDSWQRLDEASRERWLRQPDVYFEAKRRGLITEKTRTAGEV